MESSMRMRRYHFYCTKKNNLIRARKTFRNETHGNSANVVRRWYKQINLPKRYAEKYFRYSMENMCSWICLPDFAILTSYIFSSPFTTHHCTNFFLKSTPHFVQIEYFYVNLRVKIHTNSGAFFMIETHPPITIPKFGRKSTHKGRHIYVYHGQCENPRGYSKLTRCLPNLGRQNCTTDTSLLSKATLMWWESQMFSGDNLRPSVFCFTLRRISYTLFYRFLICIISVNYLRILFNT